MLGSKQNSIEYLISSKQPSRHLFTNMHQQSCIGHADCSAVQRAAKVHLVTCTEVCMTYTILLDLLVTLLLWSVTVVIAYCCLLYLRLLWPLQLSIAYCILSSIIYAACRHLITNPQSLTAHFPYAHGRRVRRRRDLDPQYFGGRGPTIRGPSIF